MIDKKESNAIFVHEKAICGLKASNCGKYLILLLTVLFTREE